MVNGCDLSAVADRPLVPHTIVELLLKRMRALIVMSKLKSITVLAPEELPLCRILFVLYCVPQVRHNSKALF